MLLWVLDGVYVVLHAYSMAWEYDANSAASFGAAASRTGSENTLGSRCPDENISSLEVLIPSRHRAPRN